MSLDWQLYLLLMPTLVYFAIFHYWPMYGVQIAFRSFIASMGITRSPWVGLEHFRHFMNSFRFIRVLRNTLVLSVSQLVLSFPLPIVLALLLNQVRHQRYKKFVQVVLYAPHFITTVVLVSIMFVVLSPRSGLVNNIITTLGGQPILFMGEAGWFRPLYIGSTIWQNTGWASVIYLGALATVNPELYEAAMIDGASKFQRMIYIDAPSVAPTAVLLLILNAGRIMSLGFEKAYLMQTPLNLQTSELIATYVYKVGLLEVRYSYSAAISLFNNVINLVLILLVNQVAKRLSNTSLM